MAGPHAPGLVSTSLNTHTCTHMYTHVHALTLTLTRAHFLEFLEFADVTRTGGDWHRCLCPGFVLKDQHAKRRIDDTSTVWMGGLSSVLYPPGRCGGQTDLTLKSSSPTRWRSDLGQFPFLRYKKIESVSPQSSARKGGLHAKQIELLARKLSKW